MSIEFKPPSEGAIAVSPCFFFLQVELLALLQIFLDVINMCIFIPHAGILVMAAGGMA